MKALQYIKSSGKNVNPTRMATWKRLAGLCYNDLTKDCRYEIEFKTKYRFIRLTSIKKRKKRG